MREAILRAADHIESHPNSLKWDQGMNPSWWGDRPCACPLAWIGHFTGTGYEVKDYREATYQIGMPSFEFYRQMDSFLSSEYQHYEWWAVVKEKRDLPVSPWSYDNKVCADCLRKFADKFFPAKHEGLPDSVKEIFQPKIFEEAFYGVSA
jgi:hypothetical protein